jgi:hypothetical protein
MKKKEELEFIKLSLALNDEVLSKWIKLRKPLAYQRMTSRYSELSSMLAEDYNTKEKITDEFN